MGKKKKKQKDFWGDSLTAKDQMKALDLIADIESGKKSGKKGNRAASIFDISDVPVDDENGLPAGLMNAISKDMKKKHGKFVEDEVEYTSVSVIKEEEVDDEDEKSPLVRMLEQNGKPVRHEVFEYLEPEPPSTIVPVEFKLNKPLKRVEITDRVIPVSMRIPTLRETAEIEYNENEFDADQLGEDIGLIYSYIISCKHPTAIFTIAEFVDMMERIVDYDDTRFIFMILEDEYILAYDMRSESREAFNNYLMDELDYNPVDILRCYISIAYLVGTLHSAFYVEDFQYVMEFKDSEFNQTYEFIHAINEDEDTYHGERDDDDEHNLIDVQELQTAARERISVLVGEDEDYEYDREYSEYNISEEEAQEDIEVEEEKIPVPDVPITPVKGEDLMKQMIQQNTSNDEPNKSESVKSPTVITGSPTPSTGSMVLPVIK